MKRACICTIGLLALVLMAAGAWAGTGNFTLVQAARPITRTYPGVAADVLGIRTGMTVSQAEAIAKQSYPSETPATAAPLSLPFDGGALQTQPLVPYIRFSKNTAHTSDNLVLFPTTPATGSTLYHILRYITFHKVAGSVTQYPPISAIRASLIRKYGPPSFQVKEGPSGRPGVLYGEYGRLGMAWVFSKDAHLNCTSGRCVGRWVNGEMQGLTHSQGANDRSLRKACGTSAGSPAVFKIIALIDASGKGEATAGGVSVSMWDAQACVNDGEQVRKQLEAAVAKFSGPKTLTSLPGASETVPPGAGPFSFYGDFGNVVGGQHPLVRPPTLMLAEDGSVALLHLQWSDWGKGIARATGVWSASSCDPSCADGKRTTRPVRVTLWSPGHVAGHWVYRCILINPGHPKRDMIDRACISGDRYTPIPP